MLKLSSSLICLLLVFGCSEDEEPIKKMPELTYEFSTSAEGWQADFSDYPKGEEEFYELDFEYSPLPAPLDKEQGSLKLTGNNHSDDLFMFIKRKITGLIPNHTYEGTFDIQIATDVPDGSVGVGGSPGSGVYIKAGLTQIEPEKKLDDSDHYIMNIDKGNQSEGGKDMVVVGDFSNGTNKNEYVLKNLKNKNPFSGQANAAGELWVVIGTDSGFEAVTTIHYNKISLKLE